MKKLVQFLLLISIVIIAANAYSQETEYFQYEEVSDGAFIGIINVSGLNNQNSYVLSINGYPGHPSNQTLMDNYQKYKSMKNGEVVTEGFYDFVKKVYSPDEHGNLNININIGLVPADYRVKLLLKDVSNKHQTVLSREYVIFTVS